MSDDKPFLTLPLNGRESADDAVVSYVYNRMPLARLGEALFPLRDISKTVECLRIMLGDRLKPGQEITLYGVDEGGTGTHASWKGFPK